MKRFSILSIVLMLTLILAACGDSKGEASDSESGNSNSDEELVFGLINWPENIAVNHVWKVLLEEEGYEVDIKQLERSEERRVGRENSSESTEDIAGRDV